MFTGIVQGMCRISQVVDIEGGRRLVINLESYDENLQLGASVAVNGTCLTVVENSDHQIHFDVIQESLNKTNLGNLQVGDWVNIERACRVGDEIGGHHVTGHIDTVGTITELELSPNNLKVWVDCGKEGSKYLIPKGWIAIDGISLTVVDVESQKFSVCLIPETRKLTILGAKKVSDHVNLEFDHNTKVIVQTLERLLPEMIQKS